jgi:hypothetical protein
MAATASAPPTLTPSGQGGADPEDSNISSPLTEVDDKDTNEDEMEPMRLDADDDNSSLSPPARDADNASDSDSALSDAASDVNSDAEDTEAETERLYDTPKNQRHRDVVVDRYNEGQIFEHTPSKLRRHTAAADEGDKANNDGDDAASTTSSIGSPSKPSTTKDTSVDDEARRDSQERKRKRSPMTDQSDVEQPLRKRKGSFVIPKVEADADALLNENAEASPALQSRAPSVAEEPDVSPRKQNAAPSAELPERETRAGKKLTRNGAKRKAAADEADTDREAQTESRDEAREAATEDDAEPQDEEAEADADDEVDAAAKNLEEMERKQAAFKDWTQIEDMFCVFRDRLYKDRLQRLEEEEQSLLADVPTHPEYLNMKQCLDDRLNQKLSAVNNELELRIKAHERRTVAQRAQIWSQFYQAIRESRERSLEKLNKEWYDVQTARRNAHKLPDYGLLFPKHPAQRVRNAVAYNTEVSTLAGIAKYEGFPAGPEMRPASAAELEEDLAAMDRTRRARTRPVIRDDYPAATFNRLGPAGEQFLKDTPWANPNHSAHKMYQPATVLPEMRPEPPTGGNRMTLHNLASSTADMKSALDGAAAVQKPPSAPARLSESPEMARSILNPAAHQMKRVRSIPNLGRGSKATAA